MGEYIAFAVMQVHGFFPVQSLHPTREEAQQSADELAQENPDSLYYIHKMTREQAISFCGALSEVRRRLDHLLDGSPAQTVRQTSQNYCKGGADLHRQSVEGKGFCDYCGKTY
jgi:hypothetical protein